MFRSFQPSTGMASAGIFMAAALWGLFWIPIRYFHENGIDGPWTLMLMNVPATLVLIVMVAFTYTKQRPHFTPAILIGASTGLGLALYGLGIVHGSVIRVTLLFYLTPIWATFIGLYWLGEKSSWQRWAAIGLGIVGLFLLVAGNIGQELNIGDALGLASGILWAIGASLIKKNDSIPIMGMTMFQFAFICLFSLVGGYAIAPVATPILSDIIGVMPLMTLISLGAVLPAVFLLFWASQFLFPGRVGLLMMSEVLVAVISASILLPDERLSILQWGGAILIVGASIVELLPNRKTNAQT